MKPGLFKAGDGVHYSFNGDSYPGTVERATLTRVWVLPDGVRCQGGRRLYEPGAKSKPGREARLFTKRSDGRFRSVGAGIWTLGKGREYRISREF